jgi:hypothetical protein
LPIRRNYKMFLEEKYKLYVRSLIWIKFYGTYLKL